MIARIPLRPEAMTVLVRSDESLYHLRGVIVAIKLIHLSQPEIKAGKIRVRQIVRITSQITVILH